MSLQGIARPEQGSAAADLKAYGVRLGTQSDSPHVLDEYHHYRTESPVFQGEESGGHPRHSPPRQPVKKGALTAQAVRLMRGLRVQGI